MRWFFYEKTGGGAFGTALRSLGGRPIRMIRRANMREAMPERRDQSAAQHRDEEKTSRPFYMCAQGKHMRRMLWGRGAESAYPIRRVPYTRHGAQGCNALQEILILALRTRRNRPRPCRRRSRGVYGAAGDAERR